jgi:hypothetical protein
MKSLDTTDAITPEIVSKLTENGYGGVIKYCANTPDYPAKRLSHSEVALLHGSGIKCGFVYEGLSTYASYFSTVRGKGDANAVLEYFQLLGVPTSCPCFFAVDYDATVADLQGPIFQYATAFHDTLKAGGYLCGVYGSGLTCATFKGLGYCKYTWLAQSEGWAGTPTYTDWDIKQGLGSPLEMSADPDEVKTLACLW